MKNNNTIPPYKDPTIPISSRVEDLLRRMTLAEKAGTLFINMIAPGPGGTLSTTDHPGLRIPSTDTLIEKYQMTHFNLVGPVTNPRETASWYNTLQERALQTRLGIPVTISSDPRNHFTENVGTSSIAGRLSQWPETLGLAALRDEELVERFADIARREYLALGIRCALHPQIDLATEYRWARINATFGEDAELTGRLVQAYIRGFQNTGMIGREVDGKDSLDGNGSWNGNDQALRRFGPHSVSCMTKHFPGGGPEKDGEDSHFHYGTEQIYPGGRFDYHVEPFRKAIAAGTRQMMPYYSKPVGLKDPKYCAEEVGFAFHKGIITGLLREELGFNGIVCTDWGLITDAVILGQDMPARAWGCEHLSEVERVVKILDAGCDQFGGESRPELVVEAVEKGLIEEERVDESVRKLLREKFELGLFDSPFVDVDEADRIVGHADFVNEANQAQRRSYTLLTNKNGVLPLDLAEIKAAGKKVYLENIDPEVAATKYGLEITHEPKQAAIAFLRLRAPYEPRPGGFEARFHAGSLEFPEDERRRQATVYATVPVTVVDLYLDRPAVVPEVAEQASSLLVNYGSSVEAFFDVVFGVRPCGKLPFDLPSSMQAVVESREDVPYDTKDPLFRFGHGLGYQWKH